ncbi:MAG: FtsX-like permease family protein [Planctomycetota bacterium]
MNAHALFVAIRREARGARGRMLFFVACLSIGTAAVTGVAALVDAVDAGIRGRSRELLAADLRVRSRRPLPAELDAVLEEVAPGYERADVLELPTMVTTTRVDGAGEDGKSRLVELKAVSGAYPFYGRLVTDPPGLLPSELGADEILADPDLLADMRIGRGAALSIGGQEFTVVGVALDEPDRLEFTLTFGPRVFLSAAGLERSGLLGFGSRVRHAALLRAPPGTSEAELQEHRDALREKLPGAEFLSIRVHSEAQRGVQRSMVRLERYLGLVALLSLVLGGVGVAQIVRGWLAGRIESVAVLRCLGWRPREVLWLYMSFATLLALVGSSLGGALGAGLPLLARTLAPDLVPPEIPLGIPWAALIRGSVLGSGLALLFCLPPLTAVWKVSPARVLRAEAAPLPVPAGVRRGALIALFLGLYCAAWIQSREWNLALGFTAGLYALGGALLLGARVVVAAAGRLPRSGLSPYLKHGLAALARPNAGTTGAIVALGVGVMVVVGMALVEGRLTDELRDMLPEDAPSLFLVDVQFDQWDDVRAALLEHGAEHVDSVPVIMARLSAVDGVPVEELLREPDGRRSRWVLRREQRLTWLEELPPDNEITAGELWSDADLAEVSVEEGFARDLGVGLGDTLEFDVQGVKFELSVTSLRSVEWESFAINFFVVVEPGVLDDAPGFRVASARVEAASEQPLQDRIARDHPNVTLLRVRRILEKISGVLKRLATAVRMLGGLTIATGVVIMAGAVSATSLRRGREAAVLKTLGVTRRGVAGLFLTEYALTGLVAGVIGGAGALVLAWVFLEQVLEISADLPLVALPLAAVGGMVLSAVCGVAASARALSVRPSVCLRGCGAGGMGTALDPSRPSWVHRTPGPARNAAALRFSQLEGWLKLPTPLSRSARGATAGRPRSRRR